MAIPNWGPMMGRNVDNPDEYARQNPPPPGGKFETPAAQPTRGGVANTTLGPALRLTPTEEAQAKEAAFVGSIGNSSDQNYWSNYFKNNASSAAMQMPGLDTTNQNQARAQQTRVIQDLQAQASGKLTQPLRDQLQQGYSQSQAQQSSLGSTMRGQSAGAAQRGISAGQEGIQRGFAGDAQMLELQQQQAAQAMLAQLLQQQQGQDIGQAQAMASGQLQGDALNQAMQEFYANSGLGFDTERGQIAHERNLAVLGIDTANRDINKNLLKTGGQALATGAATYANTNKKKTSSQDEIDAAYEGD